MSHQTVSPAQRGSVLSGATSAAIALSPTCLYFVLYEEGGGGVIHWGVTQAQAEHATQYHPVAASGNSGIVVANPATIFVRASGGNVNWYLFEVREGK